MLKIFLLALVLLIIRFSHPIKDIRKLDKEGKLYYGEYQKNYDSFILRKIVGLLREKNCSAFKTHNANNEVLIGRNYDMPHKDKNNALTGLNMVLRLKPFGKYESINGVDVSWLCLFKLPYYTGRLENNLKLPLSFLPYLCMDGMNEKGLAVAILALDIKEGEKCLNQNVKGKRKVNITILLREMLDNCASVEETISYASKVNVTNTIGYDYHLFIADKDKSIAMEWRNNNMIITNTDALTNFYISSDDAQDCYYNDKLYEEFETTILDREYHYGYGHGYHRFNKVINYLSKRRCDEKEYDSLMSEEEAIKLLGEVAQDYNGELTSFTQYSAVYNVSKLRAIYCVQQDFEHKYSFEIKV